MLVQDYLLQLPPINDAVTESVTHAHSLISSHLTQENLNISQAEYWQPTAYTTNRGYTLVR